MLTPASALLQASNPQLPGKSIAEKLARDWIFRRIVRGFALFFGSSQLAYSDRLLEPPTPNRKGRNSEVEKALDYMISLVVDSGCGLLDAVGRNHAQETHSDCGFDSVEAGFRKRAKPHTEMIHLHINLCLPAHTHTQIDR